MTRSPEPGVAEELEPGLRRVLAPNPSPMTYWGTNTYLLGTREIAVVDPGPDDPAHLAAILAAATGARISHILITHAHRDHSTLAPRLAAETGAPVLGFGPPEAGRSPVMERLAAEGLSGGGEGVHAGFMPDVTVADGEQVDGADWSLTAHWTPGHFAGHLAFAWGDRVFTGDLVMGWASTLISPPDGDVAAFMTSCARLRALSARTFHPGHGAPITEPGGRLDWLMSHRRQREAQILAALGSAPLDIASLTRRIYTDTPAALLPAAERNVFAHLIDLTEKSLVTATPRLTATARFHLA